MQIGKARGELCGDVEEEAEVLLGIQTADSSDNARTSGKSKPRPRLIPRGFTGTETAKIDGIGNQRYFFRGDRFMAGQKVPASAGDSDDVMGEAIGGFVEGEKDFVVDPVRVVGVVVVDDDGHAQQGSERLGNDVRRNEMAVEDIRLVGENPPWDRGEVDGEELVRRERVDLHASLLQPVPINAVAVQRGDLMAEAGTATSGQVRNDLLSTAEVQAVDDVKDAFHEGFLSCHCCQTCSHQR